MALAALALGIAACDVEDEPYVPPNLDDAELERRNCGHLENGPRFRRLSSDARAVVEGPCGEVAWMESSGAVHFAGIDGEPREVASYGWPLWVEGERLLYAAEETLKLFADGQEVWSWPAPEWFSPSDVLGRSAGKIPGLDAYWIGSRWYGFIRVDAGGITSLTPDYMRITGTDYSDYRPYDVAASGYIAYPTNEGRIGIVEMATGSRRVLEQEFHPRFTEDSKGRQRSDSMRIGPDGSFVIVSPYWSDAESEDSWESLIIVVGVEIPPSSFSGTFGGLAMIPGAIGGSSTGGWVALGPWMGSASGVLLPSWRGTDAHLVGLGEPVPLGYTEPRAIRGNHVFVARKKGAAVLELGTGALHHLQRGTQVGAVAPFRWGGPVAISYEECFERRRGFCFTGEWRIASWTREHGSRRIAQNPLPVELHAVGPDGSAIFTKLSFRDLPAGSGEPGGVIAVPVESMYEKRVFLHSSEGKRIRELDLDQDSSIVDGLGGERFAVLVRGRKERGLRVDEELLAVDWRTGKETVLASGGTIVRWSLDHSDQRLTATISVPDSSALELWSGNVEP